ncbi:MAG: sodium:alanine symporter family protein [Bryobacterales bacterium]|nr:sodium:alanine symporter family protein [Bryobacterales bacterium]
METLEQLHNQLNGLVWGLPMMALLMGAGVVLTLVTGGVQFIRLGFAFKTVFGKLLSNAPVEGSVTPFQALATALASTVGVGNIAGVATAISLGGPGALFWLMVSGVLGMATKFAEIAISMHYRQRDKAGVMRGGAMYVLSHGLNMRWLGVLFAAFTSLAAFGIGNMVQANSVAEAAKTSYGVDPMVTGLALAALTAVVVLGGVQRIVQVTEKLVPAMCAIYLLGALVIVLRYAGEIPHALSLVFEGAFSGQAAGGGFAGATVAHAVRYGIARGLFSNEAGLGSAPLVHCSATTDHPVRQACYGIVEVFVDTLVVCLLTGLVILTTGVWDSGETGAAMSAKAFEIGLPGVWGDLVVSTGLMLFAFSTVVGWSFYGETAVTYLFGTAASLPYRLLWIVFVYIGATGGLHVIWSVSDTMNGLMALPNLVAVLGSLGLLRRLVREFFSKEKSA